jgi:hypothetical protein
VRKVTLRAPAGRRALAAAVCALQLALPATALAQEQSAASEAGWGALSGLCSLVYAPVKVAYAITGSVIGGIAWALSAGDNDVFDAVITPAVRGDYVVTPAHLRGEDQLQFLGEAPRQAQAYAPPAQPTTY